MIRLDHNGIYKALTRAGDGVMVADANGRVVLWNRSAERVLGWAAAEAVGRTCCEVFEGHPQNGRACSDGCSVMAAARQGAALESFDMRTRTKAGREVRLNVSTLAVPAETAASPLVIHLFRDVTARASNGPGASNGGAGHGSAAHAVNGAATNGSARNGSAREAHVPAGEGAGGLTPRELEVLRLLTGGANTRMAAEQLKVSPATIRNHVQNLMGKLDVHSRLQAVAYANAHGLI
jgi:PAS domain S-box-containing protein